MTHTTQEVEQLRISGKFSNQFRRTEDSVTYQGKRTDLTIKLANHELIQNAGNDYQLTDIDFETGTLKP